ncbi:hypothetical protein [Trichormus azollae]|uniref:hypothetical protein n=1 Tax=Trichormus azollae TaxID=1164 RepID=UPI00325DB397
MSLGIGVLGTTGGLLIGDRYFPGARDNMLLTDQEKAGLSSLQGFLLEIQVHQQELTPIITPQPNLHPIDLEFQEHLQEFETLFSKLKEFSLLESQYHLRVLL